MENQNLLGGSWLVAHFCIGLVMPLAVQSRMGGRRKTQVVEGIATETFVEAMRPSPDLPGHLTFHLKHEVLHLELLSRVFSLIDPASIQAWLEREPGSQYARRVGFLFEWLTGHTLDVNANVSGAYVDVVDSVKWVTASANQAVPNPRWRVRDNLPGLPAFCPMIRKTEALEQAMGVDVQGLLTDLASEFGEDTLMRSAVWMTLRESKSSFAIEGEGGQADRIQLFADVLARRTGQGAWPLDESSLAQLQADILGKRSSLKEFGLRKSPVFVGEYAHYQEVVHYIAPPADSIGDMLEGLLVFLERTQGQSAVMRSAVAAFGFVYIHPLADGNGRVHRFLINDVLRRDGVVKHPVILPVSTLISSDSGERRAYDRILDSISGPLMSHLAGHYEFGPEQRLYADGISSNFIFRGEARAQPAWRYLDLTAHVVYLADVLDRTVRHSMREESRYLRCHSKARVAIKDIVEMPDVQVDRVIRSVEANQGNLTNVLAKEIPVLAEPGIWRAIVQAVHFAWK